MIEQQPMPVHGFITIPWDHASLPEPYWKHVRRMPNGCWTTDWERATGYRDMIVLRLLKVNPREAWALTPTCGDRGCVNPGHTCITMKTSASIRERHPGEKGK
jgi:hypothetical protein